MPRIPYLTPEQMPENVRTTVARAPINVVRMMAGTSEGVFSGFGALSAAFYGPASSLPAEDREVADWFERMESLADGALLATGFHKHRGQWRRRRHGGDE